MLRDEIALYTKLSGNDGEHTSIGIIGAYLDGYERGVQDINKWIPIITRKLTPSERKRMSEHWGSDVCDEMFICAMPEDGQEILISGKYGVSMDVVDNDVDADGFIYYGLEGNGDWDGVTAWMPLPEPYTKGGETDAVN